MFPSFTPRYRAVDAIAFVSLVLISSVLVAYILFPKKSQANMQKISLAISLWILTSTRLFTMFQNYADTFCQNDLVPATFLDTRCGLQAFLMTFGVHASVLWASMRAYTVLVLVTRQRSCSSTRWLVGINLICWGIPLAFATGVVAGQTGGYSFSGFCGPKPSIQGFVYFLPLLVHE
jgi:hypothetical protein